jgi:protein SCO1/2
VKKIVIALIAVSVLVLVFSLVVGRKATVQLPVLGPVPSFRLTTQHGQPFDHDRLYGKVSVVDFIFTSCQGPCPIMSGNMQELYTAFADEDRVQFISVTVDPDRDTEAVLRDYAQRFGVTDERWTFLRGPIDQVQSLSEEGFSLAAGELPFSHSIRFILVDPQGQIRGYYNGTDRPAMERLQQHIRVLLRG